MLAPPSSPIDPVIGHLVELAAETADRQPGLLAVLARVGDPRHRRGVRHRLTVILGLALCAVVAGARSFTAIAEWAADADERTLRVLGTGGRIPSESTFRRTLHLHVTPVILPCAGSWLDLELRIYAPQEGFTQGYPRCPSEDFNRRMAECLADEYLAVLRNAVPAATGGTA